MKKAEIISGKLLEGELRSDRFLSGLERCVEITSQKGYEACFAIGKKLFGRKIIYPSFIEIGDEKSISSTTNNARCEQAKKRYEEVIGRKYNKDDIVGFTLFCMKNLEGAQASYPPIEEKYRPFFEGEDEIKDYYDLIELHTHPSGRITPSKNDVMHLNQARRDNQRRYGISLNPISIIAGVTPDSDSIHLLILQENGRMPISTVKLEKMYRGLALYIQTNVTGENMERVLHSLLFEPFHEHYTVGFATFHKAERDIHFEFDFDQFAFSYEEKV